MDQNISITLKDAETGIEYHTYVLPNDAHKVQTGK